MRIASWTAVGVLALDQMTKLAVVWGMGLHEKSEIAVWPPFLVFRMAWNRGINFGLFSHSADVVRWALIALALAISLWVWIWVRREPHARLVQVAAGMLIGGALGNVIDRLVYGAVADFLNMSLPGVENPYSFNVADVAIFVGALGLVLFTGRDKTP